MTQISNTMNQRVDREWLPTGDLPHDAVKALREAMERVAEVALTDESGGQETEFQRRWQLAKDAAAASSRFPEDVRLVEALSQANAAVAAAGSLHGKDRFPGRVASRGFIGVVNLAASLARRRELSEDREGALNYYVTALSLIKTLRALAGFGGFDGAVYWNLVKGATVAGEMAAERRATLVEFLEAVDRNLFNEYAPLMARGDARTPRAFGSIAFFRAALLQVKDPSYIESLRNELLRMRDELEPGPGAARPQFQAQFKVLMDEAAFRIGEKRRASFIW